MSLVEREGEGEGEGEGGRGRGKQLEGLSRVLVLRERKRRKAIRWSVFGYWSEKRDGLFLSLGRRKSEGERIRISWSVFESWGEKERGREDKN